MEDVEDAASWSNGAEPRTPFFDSINDFETDELAGDEEDEDEGHESPFDVPPNLTTTLKQFVEQYNQALKSKVEKEFHAEHKSFELVVPCATSFGIEKQFQQVYTQKKFLEFQKELATVGFCRIDAKEDDGPGTKFHVFEQVALGADRSKKEFLAMSSIIMLISQFP